MGVDLGPLVQKVSFQVLWDCLLCPIPYCSLDHILRWISRVVFLCRSQPIKSPLSTRDRYELPVWWFMLVRFSALGSAEHRCSVLPSLASSSGHPRGSGAGQLGHCLWVGAHWRRQGREALNTCSAEIQTGWTTSSWPYLLLTLESNLLKLWLCYLCLVLLTSLLLCDLLLNLLNFRVTSQFDGEKPAQFSCLLSSPTFSNRNSWSHHYLPIPEYASKARASFIFHICIISHTDASSP